MARMMAKAKTPRVNGAAAPAAFSAVSVWGGDLDQWPTSWMGLERDLPAGEQLLACFRSFVDQLTSSKLSPKTIRRHVDNLWLLGGEIIRELHEDSSLRKLPAERLLCRVIHEDGGPLIHNGSEDEQRSFDSTCRKLYRFLSQPRH